jgi:hypothetical protein
MSRKPKAPAGCGARVRVSRGYTIPVLPARKPLNREKRNNRGEIPVGPIREAFLKKYNNDEISFRELAVALGHGPKETTYVQIMLGLKPYKGTRPQGNGKGTGTSQGREGQSGWRYRQHLEYKTALKIAEALGVDPIEVGV